MQPNPLKPIQFILTLTFIAVIVTLIFVVLHYFGIQGRSAFSSANDATTFMDTMTGSVIGQVTKVEKNLITVQNKSGLKHQFKAASIMTVSGVGADGKIMSSSDLSKIELNKEVAITFTTNNGSVEINSIMPLSPPPAVTPTTSAPAPQASSSARPASPKATAAPVSPEADS